MQCSVWNHPVSNSLNYKTHKQQSFHSNQPPSHPKNPLPFNPQIFQLNPPPPPPQLSPAHPLAPLSIKISYERYSQPTFSSTSVPKQNPSPTHPTRPKKITRSGQTPPVADCFVYQKEGGHLKGHKGRTEFLSFFLSRVGDRCSVILFSPCQNVSGWIFV